jgi:hypothetical protein
LSGCLVAPDPEGLDTFISGPPRPTSRPTLKSEEPVLAVAQGVLLDPAADLVHDLGAVLDDVEGVQVPWRLSANGA